MALQLNRARASQFVKVLAMVFLSCGVMFAPMFHAAADVAGAGGETVLHVAAAAAPGGNGSSWEQAFRHPQQALDAAAGIEGSVVIKVAQGTYVPTRRVFIDDPRSATFALTETVSLLGGYAGTGAFNPDDRNIADFETILSGDRNGDDSPDFKNHYDNVYHVVTASGAGPLVVIEGLTITAGNANVYSPSDYLPSPYNGSGILIVQGQPKVRKCTFINNRAGRGAIFVSGSVFAISECRFEENVGLAEASAIYAIDASLTVAHSTFLGNTADDGATVSVIEGPEPSTPSCAIAYCVFENNVGWNGGALVSDGSAVVVESSFKNNTAVGLGGALLLRNQSYIGNCHFEGNTTEYAGGAVALMMAAGAEIYNCTFTTNRSDYLGGAVMCFQSGATVLANCLFDHNVAVFGGAISVTDIMSAEVINCTLVDNEANGIEMVDFLGELSVHNSILWGNTPSQIETTIHPPPPSSPSLVESVVVTFSNIQGGWAGAGSNNINLDPNLVSFGCHSRLLANDSPCVDSGSNSVIPSGILTDLAGNPRVQNIVVDMGAFEGRFQAGAPTACENVLIPNVIAQLVPSGAGFDPMHEPAIAIRNEGTMTFVSVEVTSFDSPLHPPVGEFNEIGTALRVLTSMNNGEFWMRVFIPFDQSNLNGFAPEDVELTYFDETITVWKHAASGNLQPSPGHDGPLGDRFFNQGIGGSSMSGDLGDHGVFWNPFLQRGFAWANVDHATDFAIGVRMPMCAGDCAYVGDNVVDVADLLAVINGWGVVQSGPLSFADISLDGVVNVRDLLHVINNWGPCPE